MRRLELPVKSNITRHSWHSSPPRKTPRRCGSTTTPRGLDRPPRGFPGSLVPSFPVSQFPTYQCRACITAWLLPVAVSCKYAYICLENATTFCNFNHVDFFTASPIFVHTNIRVRRYIPDVFPWEYFIALPQWIYKFTTSPTDGRFTLYIFILYQTCLTHVCCGTGL